MVTEIKANKSYPQAFSKGLLGLPKTGSSIVKWAFITT